MPIGPHNARSVNADHQISYLPPTGSQGSPTPPGKQPKERKDGNSKTLLTRRRFLYGAIAAGAVAAGAVGVTAIRSRSEQSEDDIVTIEVPEDHVFDLDGCTEVKADHAFRIVSEIELPYGSLVWANDDTVAACLLPTEQPSPLTVMALLNLGTGSYTPMMEQAMGSKDGFEIYDVRATAAGMVWTEANIFEGRWRVYAAALGEGLTLEEAKLLEEGDQSTETPSLAAAADYAWWQVVPHVENENAAEEPFLVKRARFGSSDVETVHTAAGRSIAPLYSAADGVCVCARINDGMRYWELAHIPADSGKVQERFTLPSGMQPSQIGYGSSGFSFCFDSIYDYGDGISNLGTYTPVEKTDNLSEATWFRFNRTPLASPSWCAERWFVVKSTLSVCAIDLGNREFCSFDIEDNSADWGDYLASSGAHSLFITYTHVDGTTEYGEEHRFTQVRVWEPNTSEERAALEAQALEEEAEESEQES